jgi:hypothetical protein
VNFWKMLKGDLAGARAAPPTDFGMHSPAAPSMLPPPTGHAPDPRINHVLPLRWSLSYALTEKQWKEMRQRFQSYFPDWMRCKQCPKGCLAKSLDEQWKYDHATFTKILIGAEFICGGCHWLKTPPFRIKTWLEQQRRLVPPMTKPPHIIDCLGWTQEKLDELRHQDLEMHRREQAGQGGRMIVEKGALGRHELPTGRHARAVERRDERLLQRR